VLKRIDQPELRTRFRNEVIRNTESPNAIAIPPTQRCGHPCDMSKVRRHAGSSGSSPAARSPWMAATSRQ
jgi:hypothetical protein